MAETAKIFGFEALFTFDRYASPYQSSEGRDVLGSLKVRLLLTALVGVAVFDLLYPRVVGFVSTSAFVNAPIISVRTPFDGVIETPSKSRAEGLRAGEVLLEFEAARRSRTELARLAARQAALEGTETALSDQIVQLRRLAEALRSRRQTGRAFARRIAERRTEQADARRDGAAADLALAISRRDRAAALSARSVVAASEIEDLDLAVARARSDLRHSEAALAALAVEAELADHHELSIGGLPDMPYLTQRLDEIDMRLIDLEAERRRVSAELAALAPLVAETARELGRIERFAPVAPSDSLVWRASPGTNAALVGGEEAMQVLDCSRRFVEVTFDERHFGRIGPGSVAEVRLKGSADSFTAPVSALRGVGNDDGTARLSAIERARTQPSLTLFLEIPGVDVARPGAASAFCDVGRSAEVRIRRPVMSRARCVLIEAFGGVCGGDGAPARVAAESGADAGPDGVGG